MSESKNTTNPPLDRTAIEVEFINRIATALGCEYPVVSVDELVYRCLDLRNLAYHNLALGRPAPRTNGDHDVDQGGGMA